MADKVKANSDAPIEVVQRFLKALENLDFDGAANLLDDSVQYQNVPLPTDNGKEATIATLRRFMVFANTFIVKMHSIAQDGKVVLTERTDILRGPGLDLEFWVCGRFEVVNGRITLWRDYFDWMTVLSQVARSAPGLATVGLWNAVSKKISG
jgi:limonene-1,2-epoxide hydrolase